MSTRLSYSVEPIIAGIIYHNDLNVGVELEERLNRTNGINCSHYSEVLKQLVYYSGRMRDTQGPSYYDDDHEQPPCGDATMAELEELYQCDLVNSDWVRGGHRRRGNDIPDSVGHRYWETIFDEQW